MAVTKRSAILFSVRAVQRTIGLALTLALLGFLAVFGLQFPHSPRLDALWLTTHLHQWGDPLLGAVAPWFNLSWPTSSKSVLPIGAAAAAWIVKIIVDMVLIGAHRKLAKLLPAPKVAGAQAFGIAGLEDEAAGAESQQAQEKLLKQYREIETRLKGAKQKRCAFLSVDVVGSTQMKVGETPTRVSATFQAYEEMMKKIFEQYGAWKQAWTPDGVMVCFLQLDLAVGAAQRVLENLKTFNEKENKLRTPFRVRSGLNEGEVPIYEDSKLEKVADRVIDVAGHMQKQSATNALWISSEAYSRLSDQSGFRAAGQVVDGFKVYEWSLEPVPVSTGEAEAAGPEARAATPPPAMAPRAADGAKRIGRYEILQELGRGAMGAVFKARDPQIGRIVAMKLILTANLSAEELAEYKKRFYREAQTAGQMSHPNIVTIHDMGEDAAGQPFLVMEFIEGIPLEKLLAQNSSAPPGKRQTLRNTLEIVTQVAGALEYAHRRGVIHRDIKPANILIDTEGRAKIADFGVAKLSGTQVTQAGILVGTPAYMAPELFLGSPADGRTDIFALGVMLYLMCTERRPFEGNSITEVAYKVVHGTPAPIRQLNPELPAELEAVIARCLAKKPEGRYPTARELATDLESLKAKAQRATTTAPPAAGAVTK